MIMPGLSQHLPSDDDEADQTFDQSSDVQEHARPRKRTRRACDKCSASRTRCDGECPCRRCQEYGYSCRYNREVRKRGRLPKTTASSAKLSSKPHAPSSWQNSHAQSIDVNGSSPPLVSPDVASAGTVVTQHQYGIQPLSIVDPTTNGAGILHLDTSVGSNSHHDVSSAASGHHMHEHFPAPLSVTSLAHAQGDFQQGLPDRRNSRIMQNNSAASITGLSAGLGPESEVAMSDESLGYPSPANNGATASAAAMYSRPNGTAASLHSATTRSVRDRGSFSTTATTAGRQDPISGAGGAGGFTTDFLHKAPTEDCCYRFLDPVLPYIRNIMPASVACDLLDIFLTDPGSSLFRAASPYILTRVFRKKSILHRTEPRATTPALLATILWCVSQTADIMLLHVPGSRAKVVNDLYDLATSLISERDPDRWRRIHGGLRTENELASYNLPETNSIPRTTSTNEPAGAIDDVLTFILLSIAVSGGDFKSDSHKWWSKAVRLSFSLGLHREDERCTALVSPCANPLCSCKRVPDDNSGSAASYAALEHREERRRVFWLLYCLDRHLALSFNNALSIPDSFCEVYAPLPDSVWENLDSIPAKDLPLRKIGPSVTITGTGFLDFFLPLMAILGDIIEVHHRKEHPRLGGVEDHHSVAIIQDLLTNCELSLRQLPEEATTNNNNNNTFSEPSYLFSRPLGRDPINGGPTPAFSNNHNGTSPNQQSYRNTTDQSKTHLVKAYGTHILHVLHVLLHGKWDAISMLDDDTDGDDWITSKRFHECATHAISASQTVSTILNIDPELTFMSYLFGIYLLQGSFVLLLFADRMPQLGLNESVEQACENIIRAHEVCVVTLNTEFQKNFRKVLRSTLYSVRGSGTTNWEEHRARRRALSLYRWTRGAKGLAL